jgi:hypothetical protein
MTRRRLQPDLKHRLSDRSTSERLKGSAVGRFMRLLGISTLRLIETRQEEEVPSVPIPSAAAAVKGLRSLRDAQRTVRP